MVYLFANIRRASLANSTLKNREHIKNYNCGIKPDVLNLRSNFLRRFAYKLKLRGIRRTSLVEDECSGILVSCERFLSEISPLLVIGYFHFLLYILSKNLTFITFSANRI